MFANITYYKLWAGKHFGYYIIGLGDKGYGVSSTEEFLNQVLIIPKVRRGWKTMRKEPKFVARMGLRRSQRHGGTMANAMQSDLPNTVWDVMQATTRTAPLELMNPFACSAANQRLSSWADKSKKIQRGDD